MNSQNHELIQEDQRYYAAAYPKGKYMVKVWLNRTSQKYSFSIAYGGGVLSKCEKYPSDPTSMGFGTFNTAKEALDAGKNFILIQET